MKPTFDDLINSGELTNVARLFAKEYYENGKMGHTRKRLIEQLADKVDRLEQGPINKPDGKITNYEMIENQDVYAMALTIMCPFEAGFLDDYRRRQNDG